MSSETVDVGIDLGTSNSSVAASSDDRVDMIRNNENDELTPSVVRYLPSGTVQVGRSAYHYLQMPDSEQSTFARFKRQMGRQEPYIVGTTGAEVTAEMLAAEVLKSLRHDAETWLGSAVHAAVITVPAMFELAQCEATQRAAAMAGITQAPLLQEPIAAGLAYGYERNDSDGYLLVYDLGAGTFDVTLLRIAGGRLSVIGTDGDNYLGGSDWDLLLADLLVERLVEQGFRLWTHDDPDGFEFRSKLKFFAEQEKIQLSRRERIDTVFDGNFTDMEDTPIATTISLDRAEYEPLIRPAIDQTVTIVQRLLGNQGMVPGELSSLILVGGPTKTPLLRSVLSETLSVPLETRLDPMTVVARGASRFAATVPMEKPKVMVPVVAHAVPVKLSHPQVSDDTLASVGGRFAEQINGMVVEVRRADGGWTSGRIPVKDGVFQTTVPLVAGRTNVFGLKCSGEAGERIDVDPEQFVIAQGLVAAPPPLSRSISVVALNAAGNEVVQELLPKETALPASRKHTFRTTRAVRAGAPDEALRIHVVEGEYERPELNRHVGNLRIDGTQLRRELPRDTLIEVTVEVDQSRLLMVSAYLPLLDQTISEVIRDQVLLSEDPIVIREKLEVELQRVAVLAEYANDGLDRLSMLAQEIERDLDAADSGDAERASRASSHWKELANEIDQIERRIEVPRLTDELREALATTQYIVGEHGNGSQKDQMRLLRQEAESAIDNGEVRPMQVVIQDLHSLRFAVLAEIPDFWVGLFNDIGGRVSYLVRTPESQIILQQGRAAMLRGDIDQLRIVCFQLWDMLPSTERAGSSLEDIGIRTYQIP